MPRQEWGGIEPMGKIFLRTWRDFFIHIATIVLGLLIAIQLVGGEGQRQDGDIVFLSELLRGFGYVLGG
jgi:hypothetical protein